MKLLNKSLIVSSILIVFIGLSTSSFAQCTSFTKKQGFPALEPFTHNGQLTSTKFMPGDEAEIEMTFNAGNDYRALVLWQEVLGNVTFKIKKEYGFIFPSSEIYDGLSAVYDYGQYGVRVKKEHPRVLVESNGANARKYCRY
jgi:hypothetical protein